VSLGARPDQPRQTTGPQALYAFGNRVGPRDPRRLDVGPDPIGPFYPVTPTDPAEGASLFADPASAPLTGHYHYLPPETPLPRGLGLHANGRDVGGTEEDGHHILYPTERMTLAELQRLFCDLPWRYGGKKT
jgi:hypothetical protein